MGGETRYNPEVITNPEHGKDFEIEVKIVNLGNPDLLVTKLEAIGADLEIPKRRIVDRYFNVDESSLPELSKPSDINVSKVSDYENLEKVILFLGFSILSKTKDIWEISRTVPAPRRTVRIRLDGDKYQLTVKSPRVKNTTHDNRIEMNINIDSPEVAEGILFKMGYQRKSLTEKDRLSYRLDDCLVDINYGPTAPPWGEIEGPDEASIFAVARKLGYGETDLASMSDNDYYKKFGISKKQLKSMTFEKFK